MSLKGDLRSLSIASLLQIIEAERKNGTLTISYEAFQRKLFLKEGSIVFLVSDDPRDFFGHFLVRNNVITEDLLAEALRIQGGSQEKLGEVLSRLGKLPQEKVRDQLTKKLQESVYQIFLLKSAAFELEELEINWAEFPEVLVLSTRELLLEGLRRLDEYHRMKTTFPTDRQRFTVDRTKLGGELADGAAIPKLLDLVEKGATIEDLCMQFHSYEYTILRYLEPLVKRGVLAKGAVRPVPTMTASGKQKPVDVLLESAKLAAEKGDLGAAMDLYRDILKIEPNQPRIREQLKSLEQQYGVELLTKEIPKTGILSLTGKADYSNQDFSSLDGFVLSRVNGIWTIAEILSVVPAPEVEVLSSVKRLIGLGYITLK